MKEEDNIYIDAEPPSTNRLLMPHVTTIFWVVAASIFAVGIAVGFCMGVWVPK